MTTTLDALRGRINDADSHEMIPAKLWPECFGDAGQLMASLYLTTLESRPESERGSGEAAEFALDLDRDTLEITSDTVWHRRGWEHAGPMAPGAIDMERRLDVLDFMGVDRQLLFSTFSLIGLSLSCSSQTFIEHFWGQLPEGLDIEQLRPLGRMITRAWNDFAIEHQKIDPTRLQMVTIVHTGDFDDLMQECERLFAEGIRAIWIPSSVPPGGRSPAHRSLDPFWSLCEEADATVHIHLGFEDFLRTYTWCDVPEFETETGNEFVVDPWSFGTQHFAVENFLTTMTLGGVFERHPSLRFGAIECGAAWVGPMAENMDKWAKVFRRRMAKILSMEPSAYLSRNLRATPYWFEPVDKYVNRFGLEDVYVYGSDYPHAEGGTDQLNVFAQSTSPLGMDFMEKFFVTNAELILPDRSRQGSAS